MSKKNKKTNRKSQYGMVKLKEGHKGCWLSVENKHGWSLGYAINSKTMWLKNTRFPSQKEVKESMKKSVVFIPLKKNPKI